MTWGAAAVIVFAICNWVFWVWKAAQWRERAERGLPPGKRIDLHEVPTPEHADELCDMLILNARRAQDVGMTLTEWHIRVRSIALQGWTRAMTIWPPRGRLRERLTQNQETT